MSGTTLLFRLLAVCAVGRNHLNCLYFFYDHKTITRSGTTLLFRPLVLLAVGAFAATILIVLIVLRSHRLNGPKIMVITPLLLPVSKRQLAYYPPLYTPSTQDYKKKLPDTKMSGSFHITPWVPTNKLYRYDDP